MDEYGRWLAAGHGDPIGVAERALKRQHLPLRPEWICVCGDAWPCTVARVVLQEELVDRRTGDREALRVVMTAYVSEASRDLFPADLRFDQFLAWTVNAPLARAVGCAPVPSLE